MRIQNTTCPNCCATLPTLPLFGTVICQYCGSILAVESLNQTAMPSRTRDAERIRVLRLNLNKLKTLHAQQEQCLAEFQRVSAERFIPPYPISAPQYIANALLIGVAAVIAFFVGLWLLIEKAQILPGLITIGIGGLALFLTVRISSAKSDAYQKERSQRESMNQEAASEWNIQYQKRVNEAQQKLNDAAASEQKIQEQTDFNLVPSQYQNEAALQFMYDALSMNQAYDIGQAIRLYDLEQERNNREAMLQEQIRLQQQQLSNQQRQLQKMNADQMQNEETCHGNAPSSCPKCGNRKHWREQEKTTEGYNVGAAIVGTLFLGAAGLLAGAVGNDVHHYRCSNCGYRCQYR